MTRLVLLLLSTILIFSCSSCSVFKQQKSDIKPDISQMKSICELAVMDCYYHNVAKFYEEKAETFLFWKKDKRFWIEYSGIVRLGIDASLVAMNIDGDTVTITIPEAKIIGCTVESSSLNENSYIVDQHSAKITADDETAAFATAQKDMEETAANNQILLNNAQEQAKTLLSNYVKNVGEAVDKTYTIQWSYLGTGDNLSKTSKVEQPAE